MAAAYGENTGLSQSAISGGVSAMAYRENISINVAKQYVCSAGQQLAAYHSAVKETESSAEKRKLKTASKLKAWLA
jgi:hypothetical protein